MQLDVIKNIYIIHNNECIIGNLLRIGWNPKVRDWKEKKKVTEKKKDLWWSSIKRKGDRTVSVCLFPFISGHWPSFIGFPPAHARSTIQIPEKKSEFFLSSAFLVFGSESAASSTSSRWSTKAPLHCVARPANPLCLGHLILRYNGTHERSLYADGLMHGISGRYQDALPQKRLIYNSLFTHGVLKNESPPFYLELLYVWGPHQHALYTF